MKWYTLSALILTLVIANIAFAQGVVTVEPLTNIGVQDAGVEGIAGFINTLYRYLIGIGAILAVLVIMYGGFRYMTSEAIGQKSAGREEIQRAVIGLLLLLSPVIVFGVINQDITSLRFDLTPLGDYERPAGNNNGGASGSGGGGTEGSSCSTFDVGRTVISEQRNGRERIPNSGEQLRCCQAQPNCSVTAPTSFGRDGARIYCECEELPPEPITGFFWEGRVALEFIDATTQEQRVIDPVSGYIDLGPFATQEVCQTSITEPNLRAGFEASPQARQINYSEIISVLVSGEAPDPVRVNCEYQEREP